MVGRWRTGRARVGRVRVLAGAMALLASGCFLEAANHHESVSPGTRPWFCNAAGDGRPASGHGNGSHVYETYQGMVKGPLDWDTCKRLAAQLDAAVAVQRTYPTRGAAEAAGWMQVAQYITGLGTHHVNSLQLTTPTFDPAKPTFLIFGGSGSSAPLVGLAYGTNNTDGKPPEGFAGTNDWYHLHRKVCMRGVSSILAGAEEITDEECTTLGGYQFGLNAFLLHLWIMPGYEYRVDLFSSAHPCLLAAGPAPAGDACWIEAGRDPATVPTTGTTVPHAHDGS
jgi:hypothetical protein